MNATKDINPNRIVGTLYDEYVKAVYDANEELPDWQEVQIQGAFFAGVHAILCFLDDNAEDGEMVLTSIQDELQKHHKVLVKRMLKYWEDKQP